MADLESLNSDTLKAQLESLLLVASEATSANEFAKVLEADLSDVVAALADLSNEYKVLNRGIQLREVAGGWRLFTHPAHHEVVERFVLSWDTKHLSQSALETLAVIAYHQPVTREGVKAVRGVNSDGVISSLREKGLIRELGKDERRGRASLYGTTKRFLEQFGLRSIKDLPPLEDFAPDEESRQFIRERLSGRAISSTLEETSADIEDERELLGDDYEGEATSNLLRPQEQSEDALNGTALQTQSEGERE